ncbi:unnamed protein product [Colias eurytheme]|nr:unnamed protein product [Colias eurytheme]
MSLDVNISEPDEFNCMELHSAIKNVADAMDIKEFSYHVDYLNGSGYIANVFRVIITENGSDKRVSVIVKTLVNTARKELFRELHNREVEAYINVIETFRELQKDIIDAKRLVLPVCIYSSTEKGNEVLIFEDLLVSGYEVNDTLDKNNKLEYSHVELIFSNLAKFHALSHVFEKNRSELYNDITKNFHDLLFQDSFLNKSKLRNYFPESFDISLNVINDLDIKKKLETIKPKLLPLFRMYVEPRKMNVFCHGDFWINNILFKRKGETSELCFLDFQTMRFTNPVTDLIYFIYLCTDAQFRSEYFDKLIDVYYDSFESFLSLYDIEANLIYTREELLKDVEETMVLGLLIALVELRVVAVPQEGVAKESQTDSDQDLSKITQEDNSMFIARINDVVTESIGNGVLDKLLNVAAAIE